MINQKDFTDLKTENWVLLAWSKKVWWKNWPIINQLAYLLSVAFFDLKLNNCNHVNRTSIEEIWLQLLPRKICTQNLRNNNDLLPFNQFCSKFWCHLLFPPKLIWNQTSNWTRNQKIVSYTVVNGYQCDILISLQQKFEGTYFRVSQVIEFLLWGQN